MDSESLRTASEYLNNLLLARGLLRNGDPIDFVKPSRESRAQIINLVHDLILRGDRDKEQRERNTIAYKQLRAEEDSKKQEIERLHTKHDDTTRLYTQAQAAERVAKEELKKVEKAMRTLQEQGNKMKTALAQVKAQCTNDVKKRDLELARLKTHLQGQQRGNRSAAVAPSITITGRNRKPAFDTSMHDVADPAYSLKQESNEFLTQLSQNLSDENEKLLSIVRGAVLTLRELLGVQVSMRSASDSGIGEDVIGSRYSDKVLSFEALSNDLETSLTHLKSLLTNPNFVSIEEVEVREEEIVRLREDWVKMEQRWHDLSAMMTGWKKRMATGGIINKDDLRKGMGLVSPSHEQSETTVMPTAVEDNSLIDDSISEARAEHNKRSERVVSHHDRERNKQSNGPLAHHNVEQNKRSDGPLAHHNTEYDNGRVSPKRKRDPLEPPESFDLRPRSGTHRVRPPPPQARMATNLDEDDSEELEVPHMTIEEKLSAAAEEAVAARRSDRCSSATLDGAADERDELASMSGPSRRSKIKGKPRRRKSTLSRDELAELLAAET